MGSLNSITLGLLLSIIPITMVGAATKIAGQIKSNLHASTTLLNLELLAEKVVSDSQSSGFSITPRIHKNGDIKLTSDAALFISKNNKLHPDQISDAISWLEASFKYAMKITAVNQQNSFLACYLFDHNFSLLTEFRSFLALTRDGYFELEPVARFLKINNGCLELHLSVTESLIGNTGDLFYPASTVLIIPIGRINTIYRDTQKTLRMLATAGTEILENQPIRNNSLIMRFESQVAGNGLISLRMTTQNLNNLNIRRQSLDYQVPATSLLNLLTSFTTIN